MIIKKGLRSTEENDKKVILKLKNVSNLTWAYIAGWMDGDGCISTLKNKDGYNDRKIHIKLIDREIVEGLADLFCVSFFLESRVDTAVQFRKEALQLWLSKQ